MTRSKLPRGHVRFYDNGGSKLLRLPQEHAKLVTVDQVWQIDVDEDGIHLRPTTLGAIEQSLPSWAASGPSSEEADRETSATS